MTILTANSSGGLTLGSSYSLGGTPIGVVAGNFTGHTGGVLDLAVLLQGGNVLVLPGAGNGTFGTAVATSASGSGALVSGDFNGDGKTDLALGDSNTSVKVLLGNGSGGFTAGGTYSVGGIFALVATDLTGDGKVDLATTTGTAIVILTGNGSGGFTQTASYSFPGGTVQVSRSLMGGDFYGVGQYAVAVDTGESELGTMILPRDLLRVARDRRVPRPPRILCERQ